MDNIFVIDTETSLHNHDVGKFLAHPMSPSNWIVYFAAQELDIATLQPVATPAAFKSMLMMRYGEPAACAVGCISKDTLLVGHNVGFDLLHLCNPNNRHHADWREWLHHPDSLIWDTQLAAYRLSGQTDISPSLDSCCEARGWPLKPNQIKEYWKAGISTEDIPRDEIEPYLEHDITSTAELFRYQVAQAQELGMLDMLRIEMQSRLATIIMELNGMHFDREAALKERDAVITPLREKAEHKATELGMQLFNLPVDAVRPNSPHFLKAVLYGGEVKWREKHPLRDPVTGEPVYFKTGKKKGEVKEGWQDFSTMMVGMSPVKFDGTDDDTLAKLIDHAKTPPELADFLQEVRNFRDGMKQEKTYYTGYSELTWPDGMIHGNLNHSITATGRLSSTNPNLQNAGHSPIRNHFKSRFENGTLMEVDLSQIEVVVQAFLSADKHMLDDIRNGIDFHSKRAAFAHGVDYNEVVKAVKDELHPEHKRWSKIRKDAKIVSFQKAYGAGAKKIADTTGLTIKEVKKFMEAEDRNYPNVPLTQEAWIAEVNRSTRIRDGKTCGVLRTPIGVQYRFYQDSFNGHATYKPTCIKNYPIQGFSADILKIILAGLRKVIRDFNTAYRPKGGHDVLIINTVHDSVIFDCPEWVDLKLLGTTLRNHFITAPIDVLKNTWGVDFNVPIKADVDVGTDWHHMTTLSL